jgi:NADH-quinone oxidoreductase subunit M
MTAMLADLRLLLAAPLLGALLVAVAPARWSRALGALASGLALLVALALVLVTPETLAIRGAWIPGLGLEFALELGGLALPGILITCLIGQVASLAPDGSRGTIAAGLGLQGVVLAALLAANLGLLVACHGLLAPLVVGMLATGPRPDRLRAALAAGFYLALAAAATAVAAGVLAVGHHDAASGQWSLEIAALAGVVLPAGVEAVVGGLLALAGALLLGLWPLHGWWLAGAAAGRSGTALLLFGPLRLLGLDLLLRLWLPLTPTAAASQGPVLAGLALVGAIYGALVARVEPEPRRAIGLAALAPAGLVVLGLAGQHHEGLLGALALASTLTLGAAAGLLAVADTERCEGPRASLARRLAPLGLLAAPGLIGCVGAALVLLGTARFAGLSLGASAMGLTVAAGLALLLSLRVLVFRTGPSGHEPGDMPADLPTVDLARLLVLLAPLVVLGAWPGPWLARVDPAASAVLEQAALRRCLSRTLAVQSPQRAPETTPEACAQPLRALERLQEGE